MLKTRLTVDPVADNDILRLEGLNSKDCASGGLGVR